MAHMIPISHCTKPASVSVSYFLSMSFSIIGVIALKPQAGAHMSCSLNSLNGVM